MGYSIRPVSDAADVETLVQFWNENHDRKLDDKIDRLYKGNPAGKATVFLVIEEESHECIGCSAVFPRKFVVDGVDVTAGVAGDLFVHKDHRVLAPALKLQKRVLSCIEDRQFDLVYGFPNQSADGVMKFAGFRLLGANVRLAKVLRTSGQLKKRNIPGPFAKLLSPILDGALKLVSLDTWYRLDGKYNCQEEGGFDERFDRLWTNVKAQFLVIGNRSSEILRWKFGGKPDERYNIFTICNKFDAEIVGYIVYKRDGNYFVIADFILPDDNKAVRVFLSKFLRHLRKAKASSVTLQTLRNGGVLKHWQRFGFVTRESGRNTYIHVESNLAHRTPLIHDPEAWLLTDFDSDT